MRRSKQDHGFVAIRLEGGILPPEFLQKVAALSAPRQTEADYGLAKGLKLKDEIGRAWRIALAEWQDYREKRQRQDISQILVGISGWLNRLLIDVLGYRDLQPSVAAVMGERSFPINYRAGTALIPVVLTTFDRDLDKGHPLFGDDGRRRSPHGLVQECLNADVDALWGVVANGNRIRLLRDNPSLTRPAYIEVDLERIFEEGLYPDFAAMWLTFHSSRVWPQDGKTAGCILERWRDAAHETGERARENLRDGVTEALRQLGTGFVQHPESDKLRRALRDGTLTPAAYFQELLRLVYRLLFLAATEDRGLLLHPQASDRSRYVYERGYSMERLRERALSRRHYDHYADLWDGLQVVFRSLGGQDNPIGLPGLGGLFATNQCPALDGAKITNALLLRAVHSLSFFRSGSMLARINYRDMGTEELGSVYESLLELHPTLDVEAAPWKFGFVGDDDGNRGRGSERKTSGSYYTPPSLVNELIKSALEPVMEKKLREEPSDPVGALLSLSIIDPACGSGHFLLAAARRVAAEIARLQAGADTPDEHQRQHALREVVRHCIYGVDRNPLSVELCKTALWIETIEPGKPLSFLDAHIRCGDSLVGVFDPATIEGGIPEEAYKELTGDDKSVCSDLKKRNRSTNKGMKGVQAGLFDENIDSNTAEMTLAIKVMPEDTLEQIAEKRTRWLEHQKDTASSREELKANLFVGSFFASKVIENAHLVPVAEDINRIERGMASRPGIEQYVSELSQRHRFFHWHLSFPEVFSKGRFDVVLGNPPWERIKLQEQEFFAARSPEIAGAANKAEREKLIKRLGLADATLAEKVLLADFKAAKHEAEAISSFVRSGSRFPLTAVGDVNTYALFSELFTDLMSRTGRAGLIVPTGIATDDGTKAFFGHVVNEQCLVSLYDFENREGIFPAVDRTYRFSLLTLGDRIEKTTFVYFATKVEHAYEADRAFSLSPEDIKLINPNTQTCPAFRSNADADITKKIYRNNPILVDESSPIHANPWGVKFTTMFHMSNDSHLFATAERLMAEGAIRNGDTWVDEAGQLWLPLYEAKMIHQFQARWHGRDVQEVASNDGDSDYRYFVPQREVADRFASYGWKNGWALGFRGITKAQNERSVIATVIPPYGIGHSMPIVITDGSSHWNAVAMVSMLNSITADFVARQKIGGRNLSFFHLKQFAVVQPESISEEGKSLIVRNTLELVYNSRELKPFAEDLGYYQPPFSSNLERRAILRAELDAYYAYLYGLTRDELRYILDPADVYGDDFPSETFRILKQNEVREFGEYRTRRLVLEAWDRFEQDGTFQRHRAVA